MSRLAKFKLSRCEKNGVQYWALYVPGYMLPGKKCKKMLFRVKSEAEQKRAELIAASKDGTQEKTLTPAQQADARRALENLSEARLNITLTKAIELALPLLKSSGAYVSVNSLLEDFRKLKSAEWRPKTARGYTYAARKLAEQFGDLPITELSPSALREWLDSFGKPTFAAGIARTLAPAFSYAVRQGMLPASPFARMEKIKLPKKQGIDIFSPNEARALMSAATPDSKAAFAVLLFAGVRPVELTRLKWSNIKADFIHITPDVAKTEQVRNVEIEPNLAAWLKAYPPAAPDAPLCPPNWKRKSQAIRAAAGLAGRQDTARHSYATYHLAAHKDKNALEANLGHSAGSAMLMRHYRAAATPAEASAYWSITPPLS